MIWNDGAHSNQCNIILSWNNLKFRVQGDARYAQYCGCYIRIAAIVNAQLNFDIVRWKSLLRMTPFFLFFFWMNEARRLINIRLDITQLMWLPLRWRSDHLRGSLQLAKGLGQLFEPTMGIHMDANRFHPADVSYGSVYHILNKETKIYINAIEIFWWYFFIQIETYCNHMFEC